MTLPTADEIRIAQESTMDDVPSGVELTGLVLTDPTLRKVANYMAGSRPMFEGRLSHVLAIAIATGLNYGLRIGVQRAAARHPNCSCGTESRGACIVHSVAPDTPETAAEKARGAADWGARFEALGRREP